jgi:hypothetical protein
MTGPAPCPKCGAAVSADEGYCSACGYALRADAAEQRRVGQRIGLKYAKQSFQGNITSGRKTILVCAILFCIATVGVYFLLETTVSKAEKDIANARGNPMYDQDKVEEAGREIARVRNLVPIITGGYAVLSAAFFAFWVWAKKRPLPATLSALILFLAFQVLNLALAPEEFVKPLPLLIRVLIIISLVRAVTSAQKHQKMRQHGV